VVRALKRRPLLVLLTLVVACGTAPIASAGASPGATVQATPAGAGVLRDFPPDTPDDDLPMAVSWGQGDHGENGDGDLMQRSSPVIANGGAALTGREVSSVSVGGHFSCALAEGAVYCWGTNGLGQLGTGDAKLVNPVPAKVGGLLDGRTVTALSAGSGHTCAIADGQVFCWGSNNHGQLGDGTTLNSQIPVQVYSGGVLAGRVVTAVSAGGADTCAIADAQAFCWGSNGSGQLGVEVLGQYSIPVAADTTGALHGHSIDAITSGFEHTCVLADGAAYCWGDNSFGQLGTGDHTSSYHPRAVYHIGILNGLVLKSIDAGRSQTCVIAGKAAVRRAYCWGYGAGGALGNNSQNESDVPVPVSTSGKLGTKNVSAVAVDKQGGCAIALGLAYCWGDSELSGRLGVSTSSSSLIPVLVYTPGVLSKRTVLSIGTAVTNSIGIAVTTPDFSDVSLHHPFVDDVNWLAGTGTAMGYDDGTYHPEEMVERQAMAAFLYRNTYPGLPDPQCDAGDRLFLDVPFENTFCGVIEWAVKAGITSVPANGKFRPTDPVTRGVMASWIHRSHHPGTADLTCTGGTRLFPDVSAKTPSCGNIEWLARTGITTGYTNGTFRPTTSVLRDSMAAFFHRWRELNTH